MGESDEGRREENGKGNRCDEPGEVHPAEARPERPSFERERISPRTAVRAVSTTGRRRSEVAFREACDASMERHRALSRMRHVRRGRDDAARVSPDATERRNGPTSETHHTIREWHHAPSRGDDAQCESRGGPERREDASGDSRDATDDGDDATEDCPRATDRGKVATDDNEGASSLGEDPAGDSSGPWCLDRDARCDLGGARERKREATRDSSARSFGWDGA